MGIRHEVNNALAALLANAQVLAETNGLDAVGRESARAIQSEVLRLAEVTERLQRVEELPRVLYLGSVVMIDVSAPWLSASGSSGNARPGAGGEVAPRS